MSPYIFVMDYVAGIFIDEKTRCWICDLEGRVVSKGESKGVRYKREGAEALREALSNAFFTAAKPLRVRKVRTISVCMPDIDTTEDEIAVNGILGAIGIADKVLVYNDSVATFIGAIAPEGDKAEGVIAIGDLGAISFGMNKEGKMARAGGWEFFLSDEGSTYWIAKRALRSVMKSYDGRDKKTALESRVVEDFKIDDVRELVDLFYAGKIEQKELLRIFELVVEEAKSNDGVANRIMKDAEKELYLHAKAVITKLQIENFEFATRGVVFSALRELGKYEEFERDIKEIAPGIRFIEPRYEPVYGALALALERETGKFIMPEIR
jgi:N-acetylglucosamine kinase-like BadF-type ATPase